MKFIICIVLDCYMHAYVLMYFVDLGAAGNGVLISDMIVFNVLYLSSLTLPSSISSINYN